LWPAAAVLAAAALAFAWIYWGERTGQQRVSYSLLAGAITLLLLLMWLLALSRLRWRVRLAVLAVLLGLGVLGRYLLRVEGVTGDLMPILAWRWEPRPGELPPAAEAPVAPVEEPRTPPSPAPVEPPGSAAEESVPADFEPAPSAEPVAPADPRSLRPPSAGSYPQFLGPERNGTVPGVRLARDWTARPPREVWRRRIGAGWSAFAVDYTADGVGLAVTLEQHGGEERVVAYELTTGAPRWSYGYAARYTSPIAGDGPRSTPTLVGGRVYATGSTGIVTALDLGSGRLLWQRDLLAEHGTSYREWGYSASPLAYEGLVVLPVGGAGQALVALDAETGRDRWRGGDEETAYASPLLTELAGRRQLVMFHLGGVAGYGPEDGATLWRFPWSREQPNVAQPVPIDDHRLLVSSGYGVGSKLIALAADSDGALEPRLVWESPRLKAKFTNVVLHRGKVYGLDDGTLVCLDPETGERCWKSGRYGHGQVILAGDLLLVTSEHGEVVLLEPDPAERRELATFRALSGKSWNPPALAGRYLLWRNDREAVCYELPLEGEGL
jgi:outer membrane protein assembly factor BamB